MKKICLNCHFCDVAFPDVDVRELKEEEDYLICLLKNTKTNDYYTKKIKNLLEKRMTHDEFIEKQWLRYEKNL